MSNYYHLFMAMLRSGLLGYGGGPSVIPLFKHEAVIKYKWMSDEEFSNLLAISNALPGPIATKLAAQIGYQQKGVIGAFVAIIAHIFPTSIGIVFLVSVIYQFQDSIIVMNMIAAVKPVIVVLLGLIAYEFLFKAWIGLGRGFAIIFITLASLFLIIFDWHPAIVIITFLSYGAFHFKARKKIIRKEGGV